mmetsp:Transcript_116115/g.173493  ORF Transcript_116115/g.173493 Transcript_116115/m.173493 type:complete len:110 (-) Transcript_116115:120-449(-)
MTRQSVAQCTNAILAFERNDLYILTLPPIRQSRAGRNMKTLCARCNRIDESRPCPETKLSDNRDKTGTSNGTYGTTRAFPPALVPCILTKIATPMTAIINMTMLCSASM